MLPWRGFCRVTEASSVSHPSRQRRDWFDFFHVLKKHFFHVLHSFFPLKSHNRYDCMSFVTGIVKENVYSMIHITGAWKKYQCPTNTFQKWKAIVRKVFIRFYFYIRIFVVNLYTFRYMSLIYSKVELHLVETAFENKFVQFNMLSLAQCLFQMSKSYAIH